MFFMRNIMGCFVLMICFLLFHHIHAQEKPVMMIKVSEKQVFIFEKLRFLLRINSFMPNSFHLYDQNHVSKHGSSPSPSPIIQPWAQAPVPSPKHSAHVHSHPPSHSHQFPKPQIFFHQNPPKKTNIAKIAVAVSVSAAAAFVICVFGLFCFFRKLRKHRKGSVHVRSILKGSSRAKKGLVSKKVSFSPGMDLFYLNAIDLDLEQHVNSTTSTTTCVDQESCDIVSKFSCKVNPTTNFATSNGEIELTKSDSDKESSVNGDEITRVENHHSSDDDSFHSFCDDDRLCIESPTSFSAATMEHLSPPYESNTSIESNLSIPASNPPKSLHNVDQKYGLSVFKNPKKIISPPPPPPPPPRLFSIVPKVTSSKKSSFPSRSNQTPRLKSSFSTSNDPIARVPPPPLPMKENGSSIRNPPPLPSQFTPLGKDGSPLPKLKPLHWDKVRAMPDQSMVWDKLRSSSFEFDEEMMESLFGYTFQKNDEGKSKSPSPSKHVLEPKRLQNLTILSKALNVTADQVCGALVQGNGLSLQQLEALAKMVPTKEEEYKIFSYQGDMNDLGSAERFVKAMLDVPFAFLRIEAMLFKETFEDEVDLLKKSFSMLEEACKELKSSRLFLKLLEAVLKTGNRMNVGTIRGGARAFKLDALLKLSDVKGTDGKTTLLHFVVQEMIRSEGMKEAETIIGRMNQRRKTIEEREDEYKKMGLDLVSSLSNELCNVKKTATIDLDVLASSVSNLSDGITKIKNLVHNHLFEEEKKNGNFARVMMSFIDYGEKNMKLLQENEHQVLGHVREVTEYFHGNVSKDEANPLRIFMIVRDFLGVLDHVCKELRSSKIPNPLAPFR